MNCPICKGFDKDNYFKCPECERDYICDSHYDKNELVCTECAEKYKSKSEEKSVKKKIAVGETDAEDEGTKKEKKIPFYLKSVNCPICGGNTQNRFFKPKIYSERKVDIDKHVSVYGWSDPDFKDYHPPLYLFWHCNNCRYTAEKVDFEKSGKDSWSNFRILKRAYPEKLQDDKAAEKLVAWLGKGINYDQMNYPISFKLHILGIYIQEILEQDNRDTLKLGRYYLRTAWLLRELKEKEGEDKDKEVEQKKTQELDIINSIINELKKAWKDIPTNEEEYLKKAVEYLSKAYVEHPAIKNVAAVVDMLLWLSGICLKMGDQQKGLNYLNSVIQEGQKQKVKLNNRLKNPEISDDEVKNLSIQSKKISTTVSKARDLMQDIQYQKFKAQKEKAKKIFEKIADRPPEEIREILSKKGFTQKVIDSLVPEKKKKLFGLFG